MGTAFSLGVGLLSIAAFVYSSGYYASLDDPTRIAATPYALVMILHLLVPLNVGLSAAVLSGKSARHAGRMLVGIWLFVALAALLVCVASVRALIGFDTTSDHRVAVASDLRPENGLTRTAVALLDPFGRTLVAGLMGISLIAGVASARGSAQTRTRTIITSLIALAAILAFGYLMVLLKFRVTWSHYGGVYAFCLMTGCLMALPLFIASVNALLGQIETALSPFIAWVIVSVASVVVFVLTVTNLWTERVFVREPPPIGEPHGICAVMAHRAMPVTACAVVIIAAILVARTVLHGQNQR